MPRGIAHRSNQYNDRWVWPPPPFGCPYVYINNLGARTLFFLTRWGPLFFSRALRRTTQCHSALHSSRVSRVSSLQPRSACRTAARSTAADAAAATFASAECRKRAGSRFHRSSSSLSCPASSGTARCSAARSESSPSTSEPGKTVLDRGIPARAGSAVHSEQRPGTEREQSRGWQAVGGCGTPYPGGLSGSTLSVGHQRSPGAPFKLESHACQHRTRAAHEQWGHGERGAKGVHHEPAGR